MYVMNYVAKKYARENGVVPFDDWISSLSPVFRARVYAYLTRVELGNWGNVKAIEGAGAKDLFELRMFFGPGYRAYFGKDGDKLILLLCGGDKKTQKRDIKEAKMLWNEYQKRKGE